VLSSDSILKVSDLGTLEKESYNGNNYKNNTNKLSKNQFFSIQEDVNIQELVIRYIKYILNKYDGKMNEAARILGISRSTIWRKLKNK
jgi:DNA-binding NtrC family response regulator